MELWIRSQDKENLSKAEHLGVYNGKIYVNGYEENGYCIGEYKTKERALEVLDEIEELDTNKKNIIVSKHFGNLIKITYEMPEE